MCKIKSLELDYMMSFDIFSAAHTQQVQSFHLGHCCKYLTLPSNRFHRHHPFCCTAIVCSRKHSSSLLMFFCAHDSVTSLFSC